MIRMKYTPMAALQVAERAMPDHPEPFYCQRNGYAYMKWLELRNHIADEVVRLSRQRLLVACTSSMHRDA